MTLPQITRMNIAGMADDDLITLRGTFSDLQPDHQDYDYHRMIAAAIDDELSSRGLAKCGRCGMPAHKVAGATENGQPVEIWHHDSVADDVFCGLVMHAADRLPR